MSNPVLLHLPLRENLNGTDRNGIVTATANGPVRFTADGYYAEEATTNYVANPVADTNLSNIGAIGTGATATRVTTKPTLYATAVQVVTPGTVTQEGIGFLSTSGLAMAPAARTFIGSIDLIGSGTMLLYLRVSYTDGTMTDSVSNTITLTDTPTRFTTLSVAADPAKSVDRLQLMVRTPTVKAVTFWASKAQVEEKAYATSFCMGSLGTGYSWSGTAHNSASTRAVANMSIARSIPTHLVGSVVARIVPKTANRALSIFSSEGYGTTDWMAVGGSTLGRPHIRSKIVAGGEQNLFGPNGDIVVDAINLLYGEWNGTALRIGVIGKTLTAGTRTAPSGTVSATTRLTHINSAESGNFLMTDFMALDRPLTEPERAQLAASNEWGFTMFQPKVGGALRIGNASSLAMARTPGAVAAD